MTGEHRRVADRAGMRAMVVAGTSSSTWWSEVGPERPNLPIIDGGAGASCKRLRPGVLVGALLLGLTGLNLRALDPQSSASRPQSSNEVRFS
jgi:hypothetical protein